jgi:nucleotide-binding universal stress UspA family protein
MRMLLGLDNTPESEPARRFAEWLAGKTGMSMDIVYGIPAEGLLRRAKEGAYDMIAVQPTRRGPRDRALRVVSGAPIPVLIIKSPPERVRRLLVCTGARPVSFQVIEAGAWLAGAVGADVSLLHVIGAVPRMYTGLEEMEAARDEMLASDTAVAQVVRESLAAFTTRGIDAEFVLREGVPEEQIIRAAHRQGADMIVLGASDTATRLNRLVFRDVMKRVIALAPCPVYVARLRSAHPREASSSEKSGTNGGGVD